MAKATTSSGQDDGTPLTPQEIADKKAELDAMVDDDYGKEGDDEPVIEKKEEPVEKPDSENEPEQEQDIPEEVEEKPAEEAESDPEDPKEKRYREQLAGERKANAELLAKFQVLEAQVSKLTTPPQQKEMSAEELELIQQKQYLKEKFGLVEKDEVLQLLDQRLKPVQKKREDSIRSNLFTKFPDISPEKDPKAEKWNEVHAMTQRFVSANPFDSLDDYEERFEWAYEKIFGKPKANPAQARQTSYTSVGGGSSAAKSKTVQSEDKYAHLSPELKAYKANIEASLEEEFK